jgi:hypothetical protein
MQLKFMELKSIYKKKLDLLRAKKFHTFFSHLIKTTFLILGERVTNKMPQNEIFRTCEIKFLSRVWHFPLMFIVIMVIDISLIFMRKNVQL